MGVYGNSIWDDLKYQLRHGDTTIQLIFANLGVFLLVHIIGVIGFFIGGLPNWTVFTDAVLEWLVLPTALMPLLSKPWAIITHMFTHVGLFHILINMLWLYWFGQILSSFIGHKKILPVYFFGGFGGALFMLLLLNVIPALNQYTGTALGASAGVMAVVLAAATLTPTFSVRLILFGNVQLKYIALVAIVFDFISIPMGNTGGHIAHLGGALMGYLYIKQTQAGNDWSIPFYKVWDGIAKIIKSIVEAFSFKKKPKVAYKNTGSIKTPPPPKQKQAEDNQKKIDAILDKISSSGYDSLSKEEKEFLFRSSHDS